MSKIIESGNGSLLTTVHNANPVSRRNFLGYAGGAAAVAMAFAACDKNDDDDDDNGINLGSGDVGILNYAYALEQLEAAFYTQVLLTPYSGIQTAESNLLKDIRDHEIAHREFFKAALGSNAIMGLTPTWGALNFSSRDEVLATAKAFEDLGVAAYNGAGVRIQDAKYLVVAGQIVSVEARHAAAVRDMISNGSFSDLADLANSGLGANVAGGLDGALTPDKVLGIAGKYIKTQINVINL